MFTLKHKAGIHNKVASALSKRSNFLTIMQIHVIKFDTFKVLCEEDFFFGSIVQGVVEGNRDDYFLHDGFHFKGTHLCVPDFSLRDKFIKELQGYDTLAKTRL